MIVDNFTMLESNQRFRSTMRTYVCYVFINADVIGKSLEERFGVLYVIDVNCDDSRGKQWADKANN